MPDLLLIPTPKSIKPTPGAFTLPADLYVLFDPHPDIRDLFAAERFVIEAEPLTGSTFHIAISAAPANSPSEIRIRFSPDIPHDQGYHLAITPQGITLTARTKPGIFYAFQTLTQLLRQAALPPKNRKSKVKNGGGRKSTQAPIKLPCLTIEDHPDFPRRGIYHDTARGKVPTIDTLLQLIDDLGHLKINEFQLYIENNFEFRKHPEMYDDTTPFTAEELLLLDSACRARHIDFVPSLTSLGHFEKILSRPPFRHLAEVEPEDLKNAGVKTWSDQPWTLCVTDPAAKQFLKDMYDEFVPNFSSTQFNICCDESWDLGKGRSKELLEKIGPGQMYVNWVNYCNALATSHGKRIQMWGDIILNHPDLIPQLPPDCTLLEWGYESHHPFEQHCQLFADRIRHPNPQDSRLKTQDSQRFYVAPGTASWLSLASRSRNALGNIHRAAQAGLKHGATGLLVTDWGDNAHQQFLAVSLLPFAYGAAAAWNLASLPDPSIKDAPNWDTGLVPPPPSGSKSLDRPLAPFLRAASLHLFEDPSLRIAQLAYDLGLTYERFSWQRFNGSIDWFLFREKWDFPNYVNRVHPKDLPRVINATQKLRDQFQSLTLCHPHGNLLLAEFLLTCDQILHTCHRTTLRQQWLAADPVARNPEAAAQGTRSVSAGQSPSQTTGTPPAQAAKTVPPKPTPLPKSYKSQMHHLAKDATHLQKQFRTLWLARNKPSRLNDVLKEFQRLQNEYKTFARSPLPKPRNNQSPPPV